MMSNSYIYLLRIAWKHSLKEHKTFLIVYAMQAMATLLNAADPILLGWFIGKIQSDYMNVKNHALIFSLLYFIKKLVEWALHGPARLMERKLAFSISNDFLMEKYHQVLHLPIKWHEEHHSGETINRIKKAYDALRSFFESGFRYLNAFSKFLFSVVAMIYFSPLFGLIGIILGVLAIIIILKFEKSYLNTIEQVNKKEHVVAATLFDSLSNIMTVITLRIEKSMEMGLFRRIQTILKPLTKHIIIDESKWFVLDIMITLIYIIISFGYISQNWVSGEIFYIGGFVTLMGFVSQFTSVFQDIAWHYTSIIQNYSYVKATENIEFSYFQAQDSFPYKAFPENWQLITISGLSFSYFDKSTEDCYSHGLSVIQFHIKKGSKIAIVGVSGSGKSTLLSLLRGIRHPSSVVDINIDNCKTEISTIHNTVTLIPQDPEIFENTIHYNLTLGLPFDVQEINSVCDCAKFSDVIENLPNGFQTDIREKGINLSGGQKQRLALARGLLAAKESEIILMDEPTSSIDRKTESEIYNQIFRTFISKTFIVSVHNLELLPKFDHIYIMHAGSIVDQGTFYQLSKFSKHFGELMLPSVEK